MAKETQEVETGSAGSGVVGLQRRVLRRGPWHRRCFCACGWSFAPHDGDPWFGPTMCPECGAWKGRPRFSWDLPEGWTLEKVRAVTTGVKRWLWHVDQRTDFERATP